MKISVRNLVEFVYRSGDISFEFSGPSRNIAGIRGHQKIQKSRGAGYQAEVMLEHLVESDSLKLVVGGRLDGLWESDEGIIIEEIKTTTRPLPEILEDSFFLHWAQVKTYAYIYMIKEGLQKINIQLTYLNIDTSEIKEFRKSITFDNVEKFFKEMTGKYLGFAQILENRRQIRDVSSASMTFPFREYRAGQRELAIEVYKAIEKEKRFFFQAATGSGKTLAVMFPAMKALGNGFCDKIFYLTAKTMGKSISEYCLNLLMEQGLNILSVTLTAKEKICFKPDAACHPDECEYAKGYYDRLGEAISDGLQHNILTRQKIVDLAKHHKICPFEFSLDMALWSDIVICDYNYAFDPRVFLKRFFQDQQESYTFLIDEAHNLVDRSRDMYSAILYKTHFLALRRIIKDVAPSLAKHLNKINRFFLDLKKELQDSKKDSFVIRSIPDELIKLLRQFSHMAEKILVQDLPRDKKDELLKLYFDTAAFLRISEYFDERFVFYFEKTSKDEIRIKIFCLDPSRVMQENLKRAKSSVFFSATLTPINYFVELLGGKNDDWKRIIHSPFPIENRAVVVCPEVVTLYKKRRETLKHVVEYIKAAVSAKKGNYIVYFSSYVYMDQVLQSFSGDEDHPDLPVQIVQKRDMTEEAREEYLMQFNNGKEGNMLAFAVLGGVFGEGIDLLGEQLIGSIIVGVGLPQICLEQELIRAFFETLNGKGFEYAYQYPGMNRVLQAAGRVIRSEYDTGAVILLDQRFSYRNYKDLFPYEWQHSLFVKSPEILRNVLLGFWGEKS